MTFLLGELEDSFESQHYLAWFKQNWRLSFLLSAVYVIVIFGGQAWMKARPRFELRAYLAAWSGILALFSISGALVTVKDMHRTVSESGWHRSVCNADFFEGKVGFWTLLFVFSKVPELGDTVFIVLRKQKLVFLHWYHHITVLIYTWYSYQENVAGGRYFITLNYAVHTLMYSYYAFRATGMVKIPRQINVTITLMQLFQMVLGCVVNVYSLMQLNAGNECHTSYNNIKWSLLMYLSYFILFGHFFYNSYLVKPVKAKDVNENVKANGAAVTNGHHSIKTD